MTLSSFLVFLANHLWQSTLFVLVAALLAMALKKNTARTRYWIWWIASLKFLIPFSLLVSMGSQFSWLAAPGALAEPSIPAVVFEQVAQPFTSGIWTVVSSAAETSAVASVSALPIAILAAWVCGCGLMLLRWWSKWRRARALVWDARPASFMTDGRELQMLRVLEQRVRVRKPLQVAPSRSSIEPSVFGLFRSVLVWPTGLSDRLGDEELEAILLHELSHARRRDNLTAALHMVVEAAFWFHPLVWWIGVRLVDEREKACDENVLRWGGASQVYAEGILKVCEFCLESPLACATGVTGSDLKRRIEDIMRNRIAHRLSLSRALLLAAAAITAAGVPMAIGALQAAGRQAQSGRALDLVAEVRAILAPAAQEGQDSFDVVSIRRSAGPQGRGTRGGGPDIRSDGPDGPAACGGMVQLNPGRFVATNVTVYRLIALAYGKHCRLLTEQTLLSGGPDWMRSEVFDVQATIPAGAPTYTRQQLGNGEAPKLQTMIQNLLRDRFQLTLHRDTKEVPIYNLVLVTMGRIKLSEDQTPPPPPPPTGPPVPRGPSTPMPRGGFLIAVDPPAGMVRLFASAVPMSTIINFIQGGVGRMVVDKTEPKGLYDIPEITLDVGPYEIGPGAVTVWPEIMRQLGLRMDPTRGPAEVLVIDRVEKPSGN